MDLQELQKQYEVVKMKLQELYEQIQALLTAAGDKPQDAPVEEVKDEAQPDAPQPEAPQPEAPKPENPQPSVDVAMLIAKIDKLTETNDILLTLVQSHEEILETIKEHATVTIKNLDEKNDEKQEKLEKIIQTVQEDRYRKDKLKLINRCIFQADMIDKTIYEYPEISKDMTTEEKEAFLLKQLKSVVIGIESMLGDEGAKVRNFAAVGEKINTEYQEVVGVKETDDESKDGTVAEIVSPGYVWTLPYILKAKVNENGEEIKQYKFLMQSEKIIAYKFVKQQ